MTRVNRRDAHSGDGLKSRQECEPIAKDLDALRSLLAVFAPRAYAIDGIFPNALLDLVTSITQTARSTKIASCNLLLLGRQSTVKSDDVPQMLKARSEGGIIILCDFASHISTDKLVASWEGQTDHLAEVHFFSGFIVLIAGSPVPCIQNTRTDNAESHQISHETFRKELALKDQQIEALERTLRTLQAAPQIMLRRYISHILLKWMSRQRWLVSTRTARRFARSAAKRDPKKFFLKDVDAASSARIQIRNAYQRTLQQEADSPKTRPLDAKIFSEARGPHFAVLLDCTAAHPKDIERSLKSISEQLCSSWHLCLIGPLAKTLQCLSSSRNTTNAGFQQPISWIASRRSLSTTACGGAITAVWNIQISGGEELHPEALSCIIKASQEQPKAKLIYTDEDILTTHGHRVQPRCKPSWNPDLLLSTNYFGHLTAYHRDLLQRCGGLASEHLYAEEYDLALRATECLKPDEIVHVSRILCHIPEHIHWARKTCSMRQKSGSQVLRASLLRRGYHSATVDPGLCPQSYRIRWEREDSLRHVTLIMPMRDGVALSQAAVESILSKTKGISYDILIVDNGSKDPATLAWLRSVQRDERISVLHDNRPFNYSALNNAAVAVTTSPLIGLINNDIEVRNEDWLIEMAGLAARPGTGCVGAKLFYPDGRIQHGGIKLGMGRVAGHIHHFWPGDDPGYCDGLVLRQSVAAVTAACLVVRRETYVSVGGMNERHLPVAFNDVDLCLKVRAAGYANCWTPYAQLTHHESLTRGRDNTKAKRRRFLSEVDYMQETWGIYPDTAQEEI